VIHAHSTEFGTHQEVLLIRRSYRFAYVQMRMMIVMCRRIISFPIESLAKGKHDRSSGRSKSRRQRNLNRTLYAKAFLFFNDPPFYTFPPHRDRDKIFISPVHCTGNVSVVGSVHAPTTFVQYDRGHSSVSRSLFTHIISDDYLIITWKTLDEEF
jgi:hypothetical protein